MKPFPTGSQQILLVSLATRVPSTAQQSACGNEPGGTVRFRKGRASFLLNAFASLALPKIAVVETSRASRTHAQSVKQPKLGSCTVAAQHRHITDELRGWRLGLTTRHALHNKSVGHEGRRKTREPSTRPFASTRRNDRADTCTPQADHDNVREAMSPSRCGTACWHIRTKVRWR
jgi:hypothetical protein